MYKPPIKGQFIKKKNEPVTTIGDLTDELSSIAIDFALTKDNLLKEVDTKIDIKVENLELSIDGIKSEINTKVEDIELSIDNIKAEIESVKDSIPEEINQQDIVDLVLSQIPEPQKIEKVDTDGIIKSVLKQIPKQETLDKKSLVKEIISKIPSSKASLKIIQEKLETDPMSVIEKIMELPEDKLSKLKLKSSNIDGLEQTISAFRSQLGRGYLHGGGISLTNLSAIAPLIYNNTTGVFSTSMSTDKLIGRSTAGTGVMEEITVGSGLSLSGGTLTASGSGGTVTSLSVVTANGFAGTVANPTTTPAITLTTTISGLLKGDGTAISAAVAGTDYVTDSSTNTFTNKSGNISQWTNDSGYITSAGAPVQSVSNSDGTLTISPTTGIVVASRAAITGDIAIAGGSNTSVLATVNSNVGTFGSSSQVAQVTVNAKGLVTAVSNVAITGFASSTLTNAHIFVGNISNVATDVALSGDATLANTGALTFNTVNGNVGTFGSATQASVVTVNAKGLVTAASNVTITPAASSITGGAALTKTDDTNVTLTLGGSPTTALLAATSLTLGWTGTLADARIASAATWNAKENALTFSTGLTRSVNTITANLSTGVSGGQSVIGGTASGNNLTLSSTSNATKGKILFGTSGYDEVNNRLGVGTASPLAGLHVEGPVGTGAPQVFLKATDSSSTGAAAFDALADYTEAVIIANTSARTTVRYGITIGGWSELSAFNGFGGSTNGLLIGVNTAKPLVLGTNNAERMRILSGGNVGIGTLTPATMLEVSGAALSGDNVPSLTLNGTNASHHWAGLRFSDSGTIKWGLISDVNATDVNNLAIYDYAASLTRMYFKSDGDIGIGTESPTAVIHIKAGTATASTAPLKFTTGTSLTTAEAGAVEFTTDDLFFTITTGAARKRLLMADPVGGLTSTRVPFATTNGRLTDDAGFTYSTSAGLVAAGMNNSGGNYKKVVATKTTTYTALITDHLIPCDATSAGFTVTLPSLATAYNTTTSTGLELCIVKIDSTGNIVTIDGNASETINGATTQSLDAQWESMIIQAVSATNWIIKSIN